MEPSYRQQVMFERVGVTFHSHRIFCVSDHHGAVCPVAPLHGDGDLHCVSHHRTAVSVIALLPGDWDLRSQAECSQSYPVI